MTDFFHQRVGIEEKQIKALQDKEPVHCWTVDGCVELRVLGWPYLQNGRYVATVGRDKQSMKVAANKTQFHRACDCTHGDRRNGLHVVQAGEGEVEG